MKNYRIADHRFYHLTRCTVETFASAGAKFWEGFAKPVTIIVCGIIIGMPIACLIGTALGYSWR